VDRVSTLVLAGEAQAGRDGGGYEHLRCSRAAAKYEGAEYGPPSDEARHKASLQMTSVAADRQRTNVKGWRR